MPVHSQGDWQSGVMMYMQGDAQAAISTHQQGEDPPTAPVSCVHFTHDATNVVPPSVHLSASCLGNIT